MKEKKVLIIINNMRYGGAPIFSFSVCKILKKNGYECCVWSMYDGKMKDEFVGFGIPVRILNINEEFYLLEKDIEKFDCAIAFTILTYQLYELCKNLIPTAWYIHECKNINPYVAIKECKTVFLNANNIWVVSEHAQEYLYETYKKTSMIIHNYVEDRYEPNDAPAKSVKINFLMIGSIIEIKGYDILLDAFFSLPMKERYSCEIHFCGERCNNSYANEMLKKISGTNNIYDHDVVTNRRQLDALYSEADVVIIPSRDESCSLVALEAAMMGKPVIISESVGAKYMVSDKSGWIINNDDSYMLSTLMKDIINGKYNLKSMGIYARASYLEYATEDRYTETLLKSMENLWIKNSLLWRIMHRTEYYVQKKYKYYFKAPFLAENVKRGSRFVLYGAGNNGQKWYAILSNSKYYKLVGWVDKYKNNEKVERIENILHMKFDYIFISILDRKIYKEVVEELGGMGIRESCILSEDMLQIA